MTRPTRDAPSPDPGPTGARRAGAAPPSTRALAVHLAPIVAPTAFAALTGTVLAAVLNVRGRLIRAAAAEVSYNAISVPVLLLFAGAGGIAVAAWGWLAGYLI